MRIVLKTDVDDAVQRNAMPGQTVIAGDARSGLLLCKRGTEAVMALTKSSPNNPSIRALECRKDE